MKALLACLAVSVVFAHAVAAAPPGRITHYAVVITGLGDWKDRSQSFWNNNNDVRRLLKEYGYPDEAIYRLCEDGVTALPAVHGRSTKANVQKVLRHLTGVLQSGDQLFFWFCGHGGVRDGDFYFHINDGLMAAELKPLLDALPTQNIIIGLQPCYSGAAIRNLSGPGRVIITSTDANEENGHAWGIPEELFPQKDAKRGPSVKKAYNATVDRVLRDYGGKMGEHPLLDDNGDGVGHFGKAPVVGNDGALAASRYLGDNGYRLHAAGAEVHALAQENARLRLADLTRLPPVFADESVFLAHLGGYKDPKDNSTQEADYLDWTRGQPPDHITKKLISKYLVQMDRQAQRGTDAARRFYADASVHLASHGVNLVHGNLKDRKVHLEWATHQTTAKMREEIEFKVRELMGGASDAVE